MFAYLVTGGLVVGLGRLLLGRRRGGEYSMGWSLGGVGLGPCFCFCFVSAG